MHDNHHVSDLQENILCLTQFGNIGHLDDIGVNVGLPLFLLCVGRALMSSCAVVAIAGSTVGGWAWQRGSGKCHDITEIQKIPKYRLKECVRTQDDRNTEVERCLGKE